MNKILTLRILFLMSPLISPALASERVLINDLALSCAVRERESTSPISDSKNIELRVRVFENGDGRRVFSLSVSGSEVGGFLKVIDERTDTVNSREISLDHVEVLSLARSQNAPAAKLNYNKSIHINRVTGFVAYEVAINDGGGGNFKVTGSGHCEKRDAGRPNF